MLKIGVLTSSRADFGIYLPLLKALADDVEVNLNIIAFGTHLSERHGYTLKNIQEHGFTNIATIDSLQPGDQPKDIANSYGITASRFAEFWAQNNFDWVFALGDRFEMAAAVASSIPFQIPIAHLHGGETTLGAIDNIYRHAISLASTVHFVATETFKERLIHLLGDDKNIYITGALSLENLKSINLLNPKEFYEKWGIDLTVPTALVTVHPETIAFEANKIYADELKEALIEISKHQQVLITMPNADTAGLIYRRLFEELGSMYPSIKTVENLGTESYFSAMNLSSILIGNTSSGILEAASFSKFVINLGDRQKGRLCSENVIHVPFIASDILAIFTKYNGQKFDGENLYFRPESVNRIVRTIKQFNHGTFH